MSIDPKTTIGKLIAALPSAAPILQSYGVSLAQTADQPLWQALENVHVNLEEFLQALEGIDWQAELPLKGE